MLRSSFCVVKSDGFLKSLKKIETVEPAVGFLEITKVQSCPTASRFQSAIFGAILFPCHILFYMNRMASLKCLIVPFCLLGFIRKKSPFRLCRLSWMLLRLPLFCWECISFGNFNSDLQIVLRSRKRENASLSIYNAWVTRRECTPACRFG